MDESHDLPLDFRWAVSLCLPSRDPKADIQDSAGDSLAHLKPLQI